MKIKTEERDFAGIMAAIAKLHERRRQAHRAPRKPSLFFRTLLRVASAPDLKATAFTCTQIGMERLGKREPCLYLMNHSSFIDLKIAATVLYPRPFNIVCTSDGFVGKEWLMRRLGCIPTQKFVPDVTLIRDMQWALQKKRCSVLMYPEASYSFDGTATPLPETLGMCLKLLNVPVVMIKTEGAFARDPLYNNLQLRDVKVSATMEYILSGEDIKEKSAPELMEILRKQFDFDYFKWQKEQGVRIDEPFRADCLNRVLYQCPHCMAEGQTEGKGTRLLCRACGKEWELTELGEMRAVEGETEFSHIPDWYRWERTNVRKALEEGTYNLEAPVEIYMLTALGMKALYRVGEGHLHHGADGFRLTGCGGQLDYVQKPRASYSLYADYYWYEIGDMICIGGGDVLYYCFPKETGDVVAKTRLAAEELYAMTGSKRTPRRRTAKETLTEA